MKAIYLKEINSFFSSVIGYVVIVVFLVVTGVFLWIIPETSVFDYGYATLNQLFELAPWVFMFLIPAITMRSFAEERKAGTYATLLTKPVSDFRIIGAKYMAGFTLVVFSLIPSLIYFYTVYHLASPAGNMDIGGTWGSFIGLFFIGGVYVAIGLFSSSFTDNQIVSFILAVLICFIFYVLIDLLRGVSVINPIYPLLEYISLNTHYLSVSRGVIDSRDVVYFLSVIFVFLQSTKMIMTSRKWK